MRTFILFFLLLTTSTVALHSQAQGTPEQIARKIADRILSSNNHNFVHRRTGEVFTSLAGLPLDKDILVQSKYMQWHYTNGVTNIALLELAEKTKDPKYEQFVIDKMNFVFKPENYNYYKRLYEKTFAEGGWWAIRQLSWHMLFRGKRLDDNGPIGASLIKVHKKQPNPAFLEYINTTAHHITHIEPRMKDGTIARIWPHVKTIWADDLYMGVSFLAKMGELTGDRRYFNDAARQVLNYTKYLWIPHKQLYKHCYHTDTKEHGVAHWSRANGWVFMAKADLLQSLPKNHPQRNRLIRNFQQQASGIARYQGKNGLWHQVLDKVDSYEEITGTAMFVLGMARGVKEGWLHPDFIFVAEMGLRGMLQKITPEGDVTAICVATGIMPSLTFYYNRPTQTNDPMGEGPVLRALIEMIDAPRYTEVRAEDQYDKIK